MEYKENYYLLKIYVREQDRAEGKPLYKKAIEIVEKEKLSGITILKAFMGYGPSKEIRGLSFIDLGSNLPILIEIIDTKENLEKFLKSFKAYFKHGLIVMVPVSIIEYKK